MPTLLHNRSVARPATLQPVLISTSSIPSATTGSAYSTALAATGGQAPYTWSILSAVPNTSSWLSISSGGVLSGTPGTVETETVLVQVSDSQGTKASVFLSLSITGGSPFAPLYATLSGGTMTTRVDRQFNPTDSVLGTLPPTGIHGTDQYGMTWNPISAPGFTSGVAPLIATPASLSSTIGVTIPALPDGNATCMAIKYPTGYPAGFVPFDIETSPTGGVCKRMYLACWVLMPSNFNSAGNNIKWFNFQNTSPLSNHIFMFNSFNNSTDGRASWMVLQGSHSGSYGGQASNAPGAVTSLAIPPPQGSGPGWWAGTNIGVWCCLEWYVQTESVPGVSTDGVFVGAFNGTIVNKWTNVTFNSSSGDSNGFNFCALIPYWGGGGSAASVNEYLCLGRLFIAQGN